MKKEKFDELVDIVCNTGSIIPPKSLFERGFENWNCRAMLARMLVHPPHNHTQDAIDLFKTVIVAPINAKSTEDDIDEMICCLQDLSILERNQGENESALNHIEQAIKLAESRDASYPFAIRGKLMFHKFVTLCNLGREEEAESMVDAMIEEHKNSASLNNSYVFYGYNFKAKLAVKKDNPTEVRKFMLKALDGIDPNIDFVKEIRTDMESIDISNFSAEYVLAVMHDTMLDIYNFIPWWDIPETSPYEN